MVNGRNTGQRGLAAGRSGIGSEHKKAYGGNTKEIDENFAGWTGRIFYLQLYENE